LDPQHAPQFKRRCNGGAKWARRLARVVVSIGPKNDPCDPYDFADLFRSPAEFKSCSASAVRDFACDGFEFDDKPSANFLGINEVGLSIHILVITRLYCFAANRQHRVSMCIRALAIKHGLRCDAGVTTDAARILRVPDTLNYKTDPPKSVKLLGLRDQSLDYDFPNALGFLSTITPAAVAAPKPLFIQSNQPTRPAAACASLPKESLSEGLNKYADQPPLDFKPVAQECAFIRDALTTGGKDYSQPMWNLTTLAATFLEDGEKLAHKMGNQHPEYTRESTDALWERKARERKEKGLGWPSCNAIQAAGCTQCNTCPHFKLGKSPLTLAYRQQTPPTEPSFVDPYAEFVGPEFPLHVLPPTLAKFVDTEHRAMGADFNVPRQISRYQGKTLSRAIWCYIYLPRQWPLA
jgi:hypothetical protein